MRRPVAARLERTRGPRGLEPVAGSEARDRRDRELLEERAALAARTQARPREHVRDVARRAVAAGHPGAAPLHLGCGQGAHVGEEALRAQPGRRGGGGKDGQQQREQEDCERGAGATTRHARTLLPAARSLRRLARAEHQPSTRSVSASTARSSAIAPRTSTTMMPLAAARNAAVSSPRMRSPKYSTYGWWTR